MGKKIGNPATSDYDDDDDVDDAAARRAATGFRLPGQRYVPASAAARLSVMVSRRVASSSAPVVRVFGRFLCLVVVFAL